MHNSVQRVARKAWEIDKKLLSIGEKLYGTTNKYFLDEYVLRIIVLEHIYKNKEPKLSIKKLEKRRKLKAFPTDPFKESDIKKRLGEWKEDIEGKSFKAQISELMPTYLDRLDNSKSIEKSLHYFLSRLVTGRVPRGMNWLLDEKDIDYVTSTLFLLDMISKEVGSEFDWLDIIHNPFTAQYPTHFPKLYPRPDGVLLQDEPPYISRAKSELGIAGFDPLLKLCKELNSRRYPSTPTFEDISSMIGVQISSARYTIQALDLILAENIFINPRILGLKHRWILSEKPRLFDRSLGLIERYDCRSFDELMKERRRYKGGSFERHALDISEEYKDNLIERGYTSLWKITQAKLGLELNPDRTEAEDAELEELAGLEKKIKSTITIEMKQEFPIFLYMGGLTHHLEPLNSEGPQSFIQGFDHFSTDHQAISYRLDMYDAKKKTWSFRPWKRSSPEGESNWIYFDSTQIKDKTQKITDRDLFVVASFSLNNGSPRHRSKVQEFLGLETRTVDRIVEDLIDTSILNFLYYPSIEYSGLTEGVFIAIPSIPTRALNRFRKWIVDIAPFAHIHWKKGGSLAAKIIVPTGRAGLLMAAMNNEIREKWDKYEIHMNSIQHIVTHNFSMPSKLFDSQKEEWFDPWKV